MLTSGFNFQEKEFNSIFPFYILIDVNLKVIQTGISLGKLLQTDISNQYFSDLFELERPFIKDLTSFNFKQLLNQLILFKCKTNKPINFRGQFNKTGENYIFIGSPWFENIQNVVDNNLTLHDFAFHDPLMDLLHILKNQEINNSELKELLQTVNIQRKKLKEEKNNLEMLSMVASANKSGVIFVNEAGKIYWCNDSFCAITGFEREEIIGQTPITIGVDKKINNEYIKTLLNAFNKKEAFVLDVLHHKKHAKPFWASVRCNAFQKDNKTHFFAIINDITIEKQNTEKLNVLSSIAKNNINSVVICDAKGNIEWVNDSFERLTKYNLDEVLGKKLGTLLHGEETDKRVVSYMTAKLKKGESFNSELINYSKDKEKYWVRIQGQVIKNEKNEVVNYFAIKEDITLQKKYIELLNAQKEKYSSIIANMNMGLIEVDLEDNILFANQSYAKMVDYEMEELLHKKASEFFVDSENIKEIKAKNKLRLKGVSDSYEVEIKNKKGEIKNWIISGAPNYNLKGEVIGSIGVHLDISNQKKLEKQKEILLQKLEKQNQQLNDYAQIVTHDLKSPLRSIHSLTSWIKEDNETLSETTKEYLGLIEMKVEKMDHLIQGIFTYSKVDEEDSITEEVNIYNVLKNLIVTLDVPNHIEVFIDENMPMINANPFKIQQLFQNIVTNAILYNDKEKGLIELKYNKDSKNHIFSIYDNGPGIAKENQEKIFNVFQSYTNHQMSTGIGLSIVKKIVEQYKGKIWVESEMGLRTTFFIKIPI